MSTEARSLHIADRLIWATIAAVAILVLTASALFSFHIEAGSFLKAAIACVVLCAVGWFYSAVRRDLWAASALTGTAQIAAFAAIGAPLSYLAASIDQSLWDATFVRWDNQLGFDWTGWLATMNAHPKLHLVFAFAYASFAAQTTVLVVALALTGHVMRMRIFILAFVLTTLITIAVSAAMPAQGAWGHLQLSAQDYPAITPLTRDLHLAVFHGLRDGSFRSLMAEGAEGIITFPSLHAALGLMFILAMWPVPYLRWIALSLNVIMIASTPVDGGHYFIDALAGLGIAMVCWKAAHAMIRICGEEDATSTAEVRSPLIVPEMNSRAAIGFESDKVELPEPEAVQP